MRRTPADELSADARACIRAGLASPRPVLVYDLRAIEARMRVLQDLGVRHNCEFLFPVKSFPIARVLRLAAKRLSGFDITNQHEYASLPRLLPDKIVNLTDPALRTLDDTVFMSRGNVLRVQIETASQLQEVASASPAVRVGLRLGLTEVYAAAGKVAPSWSRFGFSTAGISTCLDWIRGHRSRFAGLHLHWGGDNTADDFVTMAGGMMELARKWGIHPPVLDLGGGLIHVGFNGLPTLLDRLRRIVPASVRLAFEPGELISHSAGLAVGTVVLTKKDGQEWVCVLDLSRELHLKWCTPRLVHSSSAEGENFKVHFFGPTCYERDYIGHYAITGDPGRDEPFRVGEWVAFADINGYCASLNQAFNGIERAHVRFTR